MTMTEDHYTTDEDFSIREPEVEPAESMTAAQALTEILERVRAIDGKLDEIIEFVNAAGEQVNEALSSGLGELVGGLFGNNGDSVDS